MNASLLSSTSRTASCLTGKHQGLISSIASVPNRRRIARNHNEVPIVAKATTDMATKTSAISPVAPSSLDQMDLNNRHQQVMSHFPSALCVDDFMARVEVVLSSYGFTGENSIAMTNLCRDEVTSVVKDKIESVFGSSFNTNGLGAVLTCGVTGMGAGLSHSPTCVAGKERYVFFSFPHIAVDAEGVVGKITRPGRAGRSCACGALQKCLNEFKAEGYECNCKAPGVHEALDVEYSILKQRLARRLKFEQTDMNTLDLAKITGVAERTITNDLEYMIEKAVDPKKADYAVITGVQIHNWATDLDSKVPSLEFVAPTKVYVVINGVKMNLDLSRVPTLSPRQLMLLASASLGTESEDKTIISRSAGSTLQGIPSKYLYAKLGGGPLKSDISAN